MFTLKKHLSKVFRLDEQEIPDQQDDSAKSGGEDAGLESGIEDILSDNGESPANGQDGNELDPVDTASGGTDQGGDVQKPEDETSAPDESKSDDKEVIPGTGDPAPKAESDVSKLKNLFTDTGKPESDYGLANPANIRLARFRFKLAGIEVEQLVNEVESKVGVTADKLILRLTPEQRESYIDKGIELRKKYDLVEKREKNVILFNARIPMFQYDENKKSIELITEKDPNLLKSAFQKVDDFLTEKFGENWVDNFDAIDFVQGIKINFSKKESITPNMLTDKFFTENGETGPVAFNQLFVRQPQSVDEFLKDTKEDNNMKRSAVYRTIAAGTLDGSTDSNGVFATLKSEDNASGEEKGNVGDAPPELDTIDAPPVEEPAAEPDAEPETPPTDEPAAEPESETPPESV